MDKIWKLLQHERLDTSFYFPVKVRVFSNTIVQKHQLFGAQISKLSFNKALSF